MLGSVGVDVAASSEATSAVGCRRDRRLDRSTTKTINSTIKHAATMPPTMPPISAGSVPGSSASITVGGESPIATEDVSLLSEIVALVENVGGDTIVSTVEPPLVSTNGPVGASVGVVGAVVSAAVVVVVVVVSIVAMVVVIGIQGRFAQEQKKGFEAIEQFCFCLVSVRIDRVVCFSTYDAIVIVQSLNGTREQRWTQIARQHSCELIGRQIQEIERRQSGECSGQCSLK
jgi:hypothetical protein